MKILGDPHRALLVTNLCPSFAIESRRSHRQDRASNDQILFLVINTSAVTLIPVTIFTFRAQLGAADPTDVFLPLLIATYCSTLAGLPPYGVALDDGDDAAE